MKSTRPYSMVSRAGRMADTRRRVLAAVLALSEEKMTIEITLDAVAAQAGVSVQTVLRHFGTRDGLIEAAVLVARDDVVDERRTTPGDLPAAVHAVVEHYERRGDLVLRMLGQAFADERIRTIVEAGKSLHRRWVEEAFRPQLDTLEADEQAAVTDLLVVATDLYTWQLLRRDRGLSSDQVKARMRRLTQAVLAGDEGRPA